MPKKTPSNIEIFVLNCIEQGETLKIINQKLRTSFNYSISPNTFQKLKKVKNCNTSKYDIIYEQKFAGKNYDNKTFTIKMYNISDPLKSFHQIQQQIDIAYANSEIIDLERKNIMTLNYKLIQAKTQLEKDAIQRDINAIEKKIRPYLQGI